MTRPGPAATRRVPCGSLELGDGGLFVIAGPDVLEDRRMACDVAARIRQVSERLAMPAIFNLTAEGLITTGEVAVEAPEANADGTVPERATHRFMVKAQDASGRTAITALSVTVRAEAKQAAAPPQSTCQTGFGAPSVPLAAFVAVFAPLAVDVDPDAQPFLVAERPIRDLCG